VAGICILAGSATNAMVSKSVRNEMFLDGAYLGTDGVVGTNSSSHLVTFVFSDTTIVAATCSTADSVTGALVRFEKFSDGVFLSEASK
jgi:hypothetical protein